MKEPITRKNRKVSLQPTTLQTLSDLLKQKLAPLDYDYLTATAVRKTGLDEFGMPTLDEALRILIAACNTEAGLSMFGRVAAYQHILSLLKTRLSLVSEWKQRPEITEQTIRRPIFITGLPRSGSTFLHDLLAQDPVNRVPLTWEVMFPLPSQATADCDRHRRMARAENQIRLFRLIKPSLMNAHPIGARLPQECIAIMSYSFLSHEFLCMFRIPSYKKWLSTQNMAPSYRFHRNFLKHLQWLCPAERWVLKAPDHVHSLDALFEEYHDANVVFLHRDPLRVLGSVASLSKMLWDAFSRNIDPIEVGVEESDILTEKVRKIMEFQDAHPDLSDRFIDIRYSDLTRDPMAAVKRIYGRFGHTLSEQAEERMRAFLESKRNKRRRKHVYRLNEFGLNVDRLMPQFADYYVRFGIEPEPL